MLTIKDVDTCADQPKGIVFTQDSTTIIYATQLPGEN